MKKARGGIRGRAQRRGGLSRLLVLVLAVVAFCAVATGTAAWADEAEPSKEESAAADALTAPAVSDGLFSATAESLGLALLAEGGEVEVSADGDVARMLDCPWALEGFSRSQTGSNRAIDDAYYGYTYRVDDPSMVTAVNTADFAVVYVPQALCEQFSIDLGSTDDQQRLAALLLPLDEGQSMGSVKLASQDTWYFTSWDEAKLGDVVFQFGRELKEGYYYIVLAPASEDVDVKAAVRPAQMDSALLVSAEGAAIAGEAPWHEQLGQFLATMDYSPLWVTLKTCGTAIVLVFFLGLAAAYFTMRISKRAQDIFDTVFTIPMVLPPTVCGFLLLMLLGRNTAFGQFFQDVGFPLVFSWQATVIAATVVAFPLMYRSARGAFENLDPNMMDAARTLGWSNRRIFFKLMLPLAWSSIAAGTVLAFARALGEFGCTLFLAGNQLGSTRTIPIAIYFEWMNGNQAATWFWTIVLIVFSFLVILFINLWSRRTTRYRQPAPADGRSPKPPRDGKRGGGRSSRENAGRAGEAPAEGERARRGAPEGAGDLMADAVLDEGRAW